MALIHGKKIKLFSLNSNKELAEEIAEHLGIVFNHHRALADAYTTAEVFFELLREKYKRENKN